MAANGDIKSHQYNVISTMNGTGYNYSNSILCRATIDVDKDGEISKKEFIENAMNSDFIAEVLKDRKKKKL